MSEDALPGNEIVIVRTCPECGQLCKGPSTYGLSQHKRARHPESDWAPLDQEPHEVPREEWEASKQSHEQERQREREEQEPAEYGGPAPKVPPLRDLGGVERALAVNIEALGGMLAMILGQYKGFVATHPGAAIRLSGQPRQLPYLESTLGHVIAQDAPQTASMVMGYAQKNETVLRWVERFNTAMTGGAATGLIMDHALGLAHTAAPTSPMIERLAEVKVAEAMAEVRKENEELRARIEQMMRAQQAQAQAAAAAASAAAASSAA